MHCLFLFRWFAEDAGTWCRGCAEEAGGRPRVLQAVHHHTEGLQWQEGDQEETQSWGGETNKSLLNQGFSQDLEIGCPKLEL